MLGWKTPLLLMKPGYKAILLIATNAVLIYRPLLPDLPLTNFNTVTLVVHSCEINTIQKCHCSG